MDPQKEPEHYYYLKQSVLSAEIGVAGYDPEATEVRGRSVKKPGVLMSRKKEEGGQKVTITYWTALLWDQWKVQLSSLSDSRNPIITFTPQTRQIKSLDSLKDLCKVIWETNVWTV